MGQERKRPHPESRGRVGARVGRRPHLQEAAGVSRVPCLLCVPSLGREQPRGQPGNSSQRPSARPASPGSDAEEEAAGCCSPGRRWSWAALPAAALPVGARARAAGAPAPHAHTGQNLVQNHRYKLTRAGSRRGARPGGGAAGARRAGLLRRVVVPVLVRDGQPGGSAEEAGRPPPGQRARRRRLPPALCQATPPSGLARLSGLFPPTNPWRPRPGLLELVRQPRARAAAGLRRTRVSSAAGPAWPGPGKSDALSTRVLSSAPCAYFPTFAKTPRLLFPRPPDPELRFYCLNLICTS